MLAIFVSMLSGLNGCVYIVHVTVHVIYINYANM